MEIIKYKKISGGKYKILFDNNEIILYEDVIIKNNLLSKKNINLDLLEKLLKDNEYYEVYNISVRYIEIKMRSRRELIRYLEKKNFDGSIINRAIEDLEKINLINDNLYMKAFINDKVNLSNIGPLKIREDLLKEKIDETEIYEYLKGINDEIWISKINRIIEKRIKLNKNKSTYLLKKTLYSNLLLLGYPNELINECINSIKTNDTDSLKKEYSRLYKKLNKKYKDEKLEYMIKNELYKKGFDYESINNI